MRPVLVRQMPLWIGLAVLCWTLTLPACQAAEKTIAPTRGDVFVYVAAPLSGFQANGGQTVLGGVNVMADQINRSGGLLGYRLVVVPMDDESDSDVALDVAHEIAAQVSAGQRVIGVIGHYNSGQTLASMQVYKDLPLIVITPTSSEVTLTERGYTNFFRVNANDRVQAQVDAQFLVANLGARRIAIVHNDTEYGVGLRDAMQQALAERQAQVVITLQVAEGQESYVQEIASIRQAAPEAIFYAGYEIEAPYLRYALVEAGIDAHLLASDGAFLAATIDDAEGTAEGMYVSGFAPGPEQAVDKAWIERYQQVEYRNPDTYSINGYSALQVLAEGVKKAGTFDSAGVADALRSLTIETPVGALSYQPSGDLEQATVYIFQVKDAAFQQVYP